MKLLLLFLVPCLIFAQTSTYPDLIVLKKGQRQSCYVEKIDKSSVDVLYGNNDRSTTPFLVLNEITIKDLGTVFTAAKGLNVPIDSIAAFIESRNLKRDKEKQEQMLAEMLRQRRMEDSLEIVQEVENELGRSSVKPYSGNRWSFGITYIPDNEIPGFSVSSYGNPRNYEFYKTSRTISLLEGQLSYEVYPDLRVILNVGYSTSYYENRNEYINQSTEPVSMQTSWGLEKLELRVFDFDLGVKYYLTRILNQKAGAFLLAGLGKQFASGDFKNIWVSQSNTDEFNEHNINEVLQKLNSPFHLNVGFGAEYFFNKSLSLFSTLRLYYTTVEATFKSRLKFLNNPGSTSTSSKEYKSSNTYTKIGIGLNFYF